MTSSSGNPFAPWRRSLVCQVSLFLLAIVVMTGCASNTSGTMPTHSSGAMPAHPTQPSMTQAQAGMLQPVLATSEVVVGSNRLAIGLLSNNVPIEDAAQTTVRVRYYKLDGEQATLVGEEVARFYGENLGPRGTFIVYPTFDAAGEWGLEVHATRPGKAVEVQRIGFKVLETGRAVAVGSAAPRTKTLTGAQVADLATISSDASPQPRLYELSVDEAVSSGKPSLILFATPGFCETAVCGPNIDVVSRLKDTFGERINVVHVEVYWLPYQGELVPAMQEWGLSTEPWLFLVDRDGTVAGRYEGGITFDEVQPAVETLVQ
jgi:hypothetical protein